MPTKARGEQQSKNFYLIFPSNNWQLQPAECTPLPLSLTLSVSLFSQLHTFYWFFFPSFLGRPDQFSLPPPPPSPINTLFTTSLFSIKYFSDSHHPQYILHLLPLVKSRTRSHRIIQDDEFQSIRSSAHLLLSVMCCGFAVGFIAGAATVEWGRRRRRAGAKRGIL